MKSDVATVDGCAVMDLSVVNYSNVLMEIE